MLEYSLVFITDGHNICYKAGLEIKYYAKSQLQYVYCKYIKADSLNVKLFK